MSSGSWTTHTVELGPHRVTKRFRSTARGGGEREWRALSLLAAHAPGLAPVPYEADLTAEEPVVVMSRLPGRPLRGQELDGERIDALAAAMGRLHDAVPAGVLAERTPLRPGHQRELVAQLRAWAPQCDLRPDGEVVRAMRLGLEWLSGCALEQAWPPGVRPVFGAGDGNLANYLWDGSRVRVVDFEDSGLSDRAFELAEVTEHVGSWVERPLDVAAFLGRFVLADAEAARLPECRRLLALVWLFLLAFDEEGRARNPPGTAARQARRLTALLA
ncbi:phosphotransferase family protein [Streptomyces albidus (ex Kaewkla and Franco 2022)]|uniref:phosphotransferase family protein n=1 Tax=Streptomyces albidus (ex Kaewkla and Franco 2022) TaxID=722709 RepID=UPI0015EF46E1|nr:aminoglycoside phosphotransferase family protein [Streptomyces albidus (ex Kaewkla and Franco 2022)]